MSAAQGRLAQVAAHLRPFPPRTPPTPAPSVHLHSLSPTHFLPRAAAIEPEVRLPPLRPDRSLTAAGSTQAEAIYHVTARQQIVRRSYQEFADRARGLGYHLRQRGLRRVGILCPNTPAFLESIFGIAAAGAVNVAVNYRLPAADIEYILDHAAVDGLIVDGALLHLVAGYRARHPDVPVIVDDDAGAAADDDGAGAFERAIRDGWQEDVRTGANGWAGLEDRVADENETIALAYTSGTTGRPKGVEYTHRGAYLAALANVIESGLNPGTGRCRYLWTLPMFHAMGWTFPWAVTAVRGTHYCLRTIDYPQIWRLLRQQRITHYCAAPTVNTLLCDSAAAGRLPDPVRVTIAASAPAPSLLAQMLRYNLQPVHVYGLTETYGPIAKCYPRPAWDALPSAGKFQRMARQGHGFITSLPLRVVRRDGPAAGPLIDVRRDGQEMGEVVFAGNICAKGYFGDPDATRTLLAGGVLHSGDLAVWHADGAVQIMDRAKDIIISGGENISSVGLENILVTHPRILEAAVVAVPDARWGERPMAFVTTRAGLGTATATATATALTAAAVIDWARRHAGISGFMLPREVVVVPELPKTSTGKVRKNVLREWAKERGGLPPSSEA